MLIACPECYKNVSDKAEACPECGYPVARQIYLKEQEERKKKEDLYKCRHSRRVYRSYNMQSGLLLIDYSDCAECGMDFRLERISRYENSNNPNN